MKFTFIDIFQETYQKFTSCTYDDYVKIGQQGRPLKFDCLGILKQMVLIMFSFNLQICILASTLEKTL